MNSNIQLGEKPVLESRSKLINRPRTSKGRRYDAVFIYIPTDVLKDSTFPFKYDDKVIVRIDGKNRRLVIEKVKTDHKELR